MATRERDSHIFDQHPDEWYAEPLWPSRRLFEVEDFSGGVFDPACGRGNILQSAKKHGLDAFGSDIVARTTAHSFYLNNFLKQPFRVGVLMPTLGVCNIVCNPPFASGREFCENALDVLPAEGCKVALIIPVRRLNAAGAWMQKTPLKTIYLLTPRPSMPPGPVFEELLARGKEPQGGTVDFCWGVWQKGYTGKPTIEWLHRDKK